MRKIGFIFLFSFYSIFSVFGQDSLFVHKEGNMFGIRKNEKWILKPQYDSIFKMSQYCFITKKNDLFGLFILKTGFHLRSTSNTGCIFTDFKHCESNENKHFALKNRKSGLFATYTYWGKRISESEFEKVLIMNDHFICKRSGEKWRLMGTNIPIQFRKEFYADSVSLLGGSDCVGFINKQADGSYEKIIYVKYSSCSDYKYNADWGRKKIIAESFDSWYGYYYKAFVNENGIREHKKFKTISPLDSGLFLVQNHYGKFGLRDSSLNWLIMDECDEITGYGHQFIVVKDRKHILVHQRKLLNYSLYDLQRKTFVLYEVDTIRYLWNGAFTYEMGNSDKIYLADVGMEFNMYWFTGDILIVQHDKNIFQLYWKNGDPLKIPIFYYYELYNDRLVIYVEKENSKRIKYKVTSDGNFILTTEN